MLLTRIAHGYYFAGGFSLGQAGGSMNSIHKQKMNEKEYETWWSDHQTFVKKLPKFQERMHNQLSLRKKFHESKVAAERTSKQADIEKFQAEMAEIKKAHKENLALLGDDEERKFILDFLGPGAGAFDEVTEYIEDVEAAQAGLR
ncbi:hypothetical protein N0V87_006451 [Didymella glomerata]|uniref:Uncharacterized protein n=1 Tax=Didymella glomerata TaxID=749621 RepID=A0A9W8WWM9_9PLEO|nr:hypothetical protein N0V87_006451 [Didymella glomerata]